MDRKMTFGSDARSQERFDILWECLCIAGLMLKPDERKKDGMRNEARMRAKFKLVSTEDEEREAYHGGELPRLLEEPPCAVVLTQPEMAQLVESGWKVPWMPKSVEKAVDALEFAEAAPECEMRLPHALMKAVPEPDEEEKPEDPSEQSA